MAAATGEEKFSVLVFVEFLGAHGDQRGCMPNRYMVSVNKEMHTKLLGMDSLATVCMMEPTTDYDWFARAVAGEHSMPYEFDSDPEKFKQELRDHGYGPIYDGRALLEGKKHVKADLHFILSDLEPPSP